MNSARIPPGKLPIRPTLDEQRAPTAAPLNRTQTAPASTPKAIGGGEAAVFESTVRPSIEGKSGNTALSGPTPDVPEGAKSVLQTLLTRNDSQAGFSPQRAAEIGTAFEKANLAGSLEWNVGLPRALLGRFFAAVDLPNAPSDGYTYKAYAFVGRQLQEKVDPNNVTEVYITRVGGRKDYVRLSIASEGASDASSAQASPRRSPAEQLWKETHGRYPHEETTIMQKSNWEYFRLDFPK
jgi:hypothetical protein